MPECIPMKSATIRLGTGNVRHVMPACHVQRYTPGELAEEMADQRYIRNNWKAAYANHDYGRFRIDLARRILKDRMAPGQVADYLESSQEVWPAYSFSPEVTYWRARAEGKKVCAVCGETFPIPPCDCGCQAPLKSVPGFATFGQAYRSSVAPPATAPNQEPPLLASGEPGDAPPF